MNGTGEMCLRMMTRITMIAVRTNELHHCYNCNYCYTLLVFNTKILNLKRRRD